MVAGAVGGFVGGTVNAGLNGGNPFLGGLIGGLMGGISGGFLGGGEGGFLSPAIAASHTGVSFSNLAPGIQLAQADAASGGVLSDATPDFGIRRRPPWMDEPGLDTPLIDPLDLIGLGAGFIKLGYGLGKRAIDTSLRGLVHVLKRHTLEGIESVGKSVFTVSDDVIVDLIRRAEGVVPRIQGQGNFERIIDAGRVIGVDRGTGQGTSVCTVITDKLGRLITAFPGRP